jgi:RIO kinase 1
MSHKNLHKMDVALDMEDMGLPAPIRNSKKDFAKKKAMVRQDKAILEPEVSQALGFQQDSGYKFSYAASRYESAWLLDSLSDLYDQKWFDDILSMVKGGKEASVYLCRTSIAQPNRLLAAKVYRPRQFRNLKKDHVYREGRSALGGDGKEILDDRALHAMAKRTKYGQKLMHTSWLGHEFKTMGLLYEAGVDLPKPLASSENTILMGYVGDVESPAPALSEIHLTPAEARPLFERALHNIELMLAHGRIHADLSAYNILYWEGAITLIDFPQAISPDENTNAYRIFTRDVVRVCEYFTRQGVRCDGFSLARKMWLARGRLLKPELDPHFLDPEKEEDRRVWEKR